MKRIILILIIICTTSLIGYETKYLKYHEWTVERGAYIENEISTELQSIQNQLVESKLDSTIVGIIDYYDKIVRLKRVNIVIEKRRGKVWIVGIYFTYQYKKDYSGAKFEFPQPISCNSLFKKKTSKIKIQYISTKIGRMFKFQDNSVLSTLEKAGNPVPIPDSEND